MEHPKTEKDEGCFASNYELKPADIIPQVKRVSYGTEPLEPLETHPAGWYCITIGEDGEPKVDADDEDGAFYAQTTLSKLPRPLPPMTIEDWPDYAYRGFMLDVVRDFRTVDEVLSPAAYTYLDLAYSDALEEIGLSWAGYVDERKTFALNPNEYKGDIIGVQAQLWSSQLRSFEDATYQMLPKGLGVAERGWNGGYLATFETAFNRFYSIIVAREMPVWERKGYVFKKR